MLLLGLVIVALAVYLLARGVEVRLVLLGAGLLLSAAAGQPLLLADDGMYIKPVFGLNDIGAQLCPPPGPGRIVMV